MRRVCWLPRRKNIVFARKWGWRLGLGIPIANENKKIFTKPISKRTVWYSKGKITKDMYIFAQEKSEVQE